MNQRPNGDESIDVYSLVLSGRSWPRLDILIEVALKNECVH